MQYIAGKLEKFSRKGLRRAEPPGLSEMTSLLKGQLFLRASAERGAEGLKSWNRNLGRDLLGFIKSQPFARVSKQNGVTHIEKEG